jgi:hypothetical protein
MSNGSPHLSPQRTAPMASSMESGHNSVFRIDTDALQQQQQQRQQQQQQPYVDDSRKLSQIWDDSYGHRRLGDVAKVSYRLMIQEALKECVNDDMATSNASLLAIPLVYVNPTDVIQCTSWNVTASAPTPTPAPTPDPATTSQASAAAFCDACALGEPSILNVDLPPHHLMPYSHAWYVRKWLREEEGLCVRVRLEPIQQSQEEPVSMTGSGFSKLFGRGKASRSNAPHAWVLYVTRA